MSRTGVHEADTFGVGDVVRLMYVYEGIDAVIVEDRGHIASDGGRVVRVRVRLRDASDEPDFDVPVDELLHLPLAA